MSPTTCGPASSRSTGRTASRCAHPGFPTTCRRRRRWSRSGTQDPSGRVSGGARTGSRRGGSRPRRGWSPAASSPPPGSPARRRRRAGRPARREAARGSAETRIRSYGASSGRPSTPGTAGSDRRPRLPGRGRGWPVRTRPAPAPARRPSTSPSGPTRCASRAVVQPDPAPTSSTRWPGRTSSSRSIASTVRGWELVWPPADLERAVVRRPPALAARQEALPRAGLERGTDGVHALVPALVHGPDCATTGELSAACGRLAPWPADPSARSCPSTWCCGSAR